MIFRILALIFLVNIPAPVFAFDINFEGRLKVGSEFIFDPPTGFAEFSNDVEARVGALGNVLQGSDWAVDYELTGNFLYVGGPLVQAGFQEDFAADFFRAWLRLEIGEFNIRAGRQKILFGPGVIFRPLGFFDTRNVAGILPETKGVDGVRATWFPSASSLIEGWAVPAKSGDRFIAGIRGEMLIGGVEAGMVLQYRPATNIPSLPDFDLELFQLGYHFKGEHEAGYWNESRLDIERRGGDSFVRFQSVLGVDYTFDFGEGLHALIEYSFTTQETGFSLKDAKGDRTLHQLGAMLSQPIGIDIVWQIFGFYDFLDRSFQVIPQIEYSVSEQVFFYIRAKIGGSINGDDRTGRLFRKLPVFTGTESTLGAAIVAYF